MTIEFQTELSRLNSNVWDTALLVPHSKVKELIKDQNKRIICTINGKLSFHAALMPSGDGNFFINTNKEIRKKMKLEPGSKVMIQIEKDHSKYGMPLPDELKAAWDIDKEAYDIFHRLTMGKQRSLIHIIGKIKSSEIRIKKSLVMLDYLKEVDGQLDFKELNQAFKESAF